MSTDSTNSCVANGLGEIPLYPVLTQEVGSNNMAARSSSARTGVAGSLPAMAKDAIRNALGWQYRGGDSTANLRSFQAALGKAFRFREVEGHTEWDWVPQGFSIQADMGEITGAQASIYRQAQAMLDQTLPLLDNIEPLSEAADEEDVESMRSIIRMELVDLVAELGQPGGPRVQKIDHYFSLLLAANEGDRNLSVDALNPRSSEFGGQLRRFGERLGMTEDRVNTVADEVCLTDFILLVDNIAGLYRNWNQKRPAFLGKEAMYFGTLLTRLARLMEVIAESVQDVCTVLDSVYISAAERQVIDLGAEDFVIRVAPGETEGELLEMSDIDGLLNAITSVCDTLKAATQAAIPFQLKTMTLVNQVLVKLDGFSSMKDQGSEALLRRIKIRLVEVWHMLDGNDVAEARFELFSALGGESGDLCIYTYGAGLQSITLEGLLSWISSFVTAEGRQMIEQGGKDGTTAFGRTVRRFTDYTYALLLHAVDHDGELEQERTLVGVVGDRDRATQLAFYPGFHSLRVYRALRQLFSYLQSTACLTGEDKVAFIAPLYEAKPESFRESNDFRRVVALRRVIQLPTQVLDRIHRVSDVGGLSKVEVLRKRVVDLRTQLEQAERQVEATETADVPAESEEEPVIATPTVKKPQKSGRKS